MGSDPQGLTPGVVDEEVALVTARQLAADGNGRLPRRVMPELAARVGAHDPVLRAAGDDVDLAPCHDQLPACPAGAARARSGGGAAMPIATGGMGPHDDVARRTGDPGYARGGLAGHGGASRGPVGNALDALVPGAMGAAVGLALG